MTAQPGIQPFRLGTMGGAQQSDQEWLEGCERQADRSERAVFCEVRPVSLQLVDGGLAVDAGRNGGVSVRGGDVSEAQVSARLQAHAESNARARDMAQGIRIHAAGGRVSADGPSTAARESWAVTVRWRWTGSRATCGAGPPTAPSP
jgi:hypothetical protein